LICGGDDGRKGEVVVILMFLEIIQLRNQLWEEMSEWLKPPKGKELAGIQTQEQFSCYKA
jgi:hypothetical protein